MAKRNGVGVVASRRCRVAALLALAVSGTARGQFLVPNDGLSGDARVLSFAETADGDVAPFAALETGTARGHIAVDSVHREFFVTRTDDDKIDVFALGATGNAAPLRTISGPNTHIDGPIDIDIDLVHNEIVVACFYSQSILVFARGAQGNVAPLRRITGPKTGFDYGYGVAVSAAAGEIFVTSPGRVATFDRLANGNVAPKRVITGNKVGLDHVSGVTFDPFRDELIAMSPYSIASFARQASGNAAPLRRIDAVGPLINPVDIALLGSSEMVVADDSFSAEEEEAFIAVFDRLASGAANSKRRIRGLATGLVAPGGVAVDRRALLLGNGRFAVEATWRTADGVGGAQPVALSNDTGYLWFFGQQNVEVVVKVLNGCAANGRFWVFAAGLTNTAVELAVTDLKTGKVKLYKNPQNKAFQPIQDTGAFATCGAGGADASEIDSGLAVEAAAPIRASAATVAVAEPAFGCAGLCLNGDRFEVHGTWTTHDGAIGTAQGVKITADTGYQWFFNSQNVETVMKVLDGCAVNGYYWVFAAGLTNVGVELTVTDKKTGATKVYTNAVDHPFQPIQDTAAFASCP